MDAKHNQAFLPFTQPSLDEPTIAAVVEVLRSGWLTSGSKVQAFETALSALLGQRVVKVMNSGTAALRIALRLANIGEGDEVITTPLSWVATSNVILEAGAKVAFVDVEFATRNIDLALVETAVNRQTRAIMPVDLAGLPVDRHRLYEIARKTKLRVIEDAAQSMGSVWQQQRVGAIGDFVAFSFHANKNITTGEGGALVLPQDIDQSLCEQLRLQGVQRGLDGAMDVAVLGYKSNMTDIAAAIGLGQLQQLDLITARRRWLANSYFEHIKPQWGLQLPPLDNGHSNWHMFQVLLPLGINRSHFIEKMRAQGIGLGVHYPAIHLFSLYRKIGYAPGDFPIAEDIAKRIVTLPLFPAMTETDVHRVCKAIEICLAK
jgi:dTDP-4-amino-4,6-dideoxygalactose transaminase